MKTFIFTILAFVISTAQANDLSCGNQLKQIVSGQKKSQTINRQTYVFAAQALKHYRSELRPEFPVSIQTFEKYVLGAKTLGYKIEITDETDEGLVSYYFNDKGQLVSGFWHNQSPVRFWFCR